MKSSENSNECFEILISNYEDIILARQKVKSFMQKTGFSVLAQTRIVTAVSELARNIVVHAGQGKMSAYQITKKRNRPGLKCVFKDQGPGISNIDEAMKEGFSTSNSLGLGLSGARKLCNEFHIESAEKKGTTISIVEWL
ncbi:anti-sigma regulatory factor [Desulfonema magnum]|uniref:Histidine kinase superfamily protein n=1 Tax=Desulfonema magnum TaxID=45655 RepID=A0A975BML8_9BACT|nr:anti-sigma regulatory factor [Desulfonema magnum]QTA88052.1 Histidine kinase superfamily protein [Desulfonema magnum]